MAIRPLPYEQLSALLAVVEQGSFQAAGRELRITQSAVSQRVSQLEELLGEPLLVRSNPPGLTAAGEELAAHTRRVMALEEELLSRRSSKQLRARLGINADSLATWFMPALAQFWQKRRVMVELDVENEDYTFSRMREGIVTACVSSRKVPLPGCEAEKLGTMRYVCCSSRDFYKTHFSGGLTKEKLLLAPAVLFNNKDSVHQRFLERTFKLRSAKYPKHVVPSSQGFLAVILEGMAYGLVPELQASEYLKSKRLKNIVPEKFVNVDLYYHYPRFETDWEHDLRRTIVEAAADML